MIRPIKFRGWDGYNKEWIYGSLRSYRDMWFSISYINPHYDPESDDGLLHGYISEWKVDPTSVGQYTGFTDKNGREVYEGDIVTDEFGTVGVVEWQAGAFVVNVPDVHIFKIAECFDNSYQMWIIGNMHDNPEILKTGKGE